MSPISTKDLCDQARRLLKAGDVERAVRHYQLATLEAPADPDPWVGLGLCQKHQGRPEVAELALTVARAMGASHPALLLHRAECRRQQGHGDEARQDLTEALAEAEAAGDVATAARVRRSLASTAQEVSP